ncbi:MAG: glycosyltransferase family 2 protein [Gammaproteobacteria bacterium]
MPLISIITPVHNGEPYLSQCIESVLAQSYHNWEFIIVNNQSTDRTLEIAQSYQQEESRITIINTSELLSALENHNFAVKQMSADSQYCKILHADDWLYPECLAEMVTLAISKASIGVVGAYSMAGKTMRCRGLNKDLKIITGIEVGRLSLLGEFYPFFSPSSTLLRADLIRNRPFFYNPEKLHADVELMYEILPGCDFGFVHQVLTGIRIHEDSETSKSAKPLNTILWSNFDLFIRFAHDFLDKNEFDTRLKALIVKYYEFLANGFWEGRDKTFWQYHRKGLSLSGQPLNHSKLFFAIISVLLFQPKPTIKKLIKRFGFFRN